MNTTHPLTVADVLDIVQSQICIYGNQALFLEVEPDNHSFDLFAGEESQEPILECVSYDERCDMDGGLAAFAERLEEFDQDLIIYCSDDAQIATGFRIGFKGEDGFVETITSEEMSQPTFFPSQVG